jgi:hypothetical protein
MKLGIYIVIILLIILLLFYFINKIIKIENYTNITRDLQRSYPEETTAELPKVTRVMYEEAITTWKPYIIDKYYQPGYSNYFYRNGYMYPVY